MRRVTLNPGRTGFLDILEAMGAQVVRSATACCTGIRWATSRSPAPNCAGIRVGGALAVRALDELPLVAVLGAAATGETVVAGAGELRVKESDRVGGGGAAGAGPRRNGRGAARMASWCKAGTSLGGGVVPAGGDHRIAMAAAVAAVATRYEVTVAGFEAVEASWPGFGEALEGLWS